MSDTITPPRKRVQQSFAHIDPNDSKKYRVDRAAKNQTDIMSIIRSPQRLAMAAERMEKSADSLFVGDPNEDTSITPFARRQMTFASAAQLVDGVRASFNSLPSQVRDRFRNRPEELVEWLGNPDNAVEAEKLGLNSPHKPKVPDPKPKKTVPDPEPKKTVSDPKLKKEEDSAE